MSADGGDERNVFGQAFERGGEKITTLLRGSISRIGLLILFRELATC